MAKLMRWVVLCALGFSLPAVSLWAQELIPLDPAEFGYSDVVYLEGSTYVVVFDTKGHEDEARIGLLTLEEEAMPLLVGLTGIDWGDPRSRASDLEAICAVPGRAGEFLALESGPWEGRPGRIFRLRVTPKSAVVLGADDMPTLAPNDLGPFHSVVYAVAQVESTADAPIGVIPVPGVSWEIAGHKVEGVAAPPPSSRYALILSAFEDELMGGGVRVLHAVAPMGRRRLSR